MLSFQIDLSPASEPEYQKPHYTPQCVRCGRFCRILSDKLEYNGSFTQNYVTFDCNRCGVYTESMW